MPRIQNEEIFQSRLSGTEKLHKQISGKCADQNPPGKSLHAQPGSQQDSTRNNSQIVKQGRQCGNKKLLFAELNGHQEPADKEE